MLYRVLWYSFSRTISSLFPPLIYLQRSPAEGIAQELGPEPTTTGPSPPDAFLQSLWQLCRQHPRSTEEESPSAPVPPSSRKRIVMADTTTYSILTSPANLRDAIVRTIMRMCHYSEFRKPVSIYENLLISVNAHSWCSSKKLHPSTNEVSQSKYTTTHLTSRIRMWTSWSSMAGILNWRGNV